MTLLLTGFMPFEGVSVNPTQLIVEHMQRTRPDIRALVFPTEYHASAAMLRAAILEYQPDAVIMLGVAQNRTAITPERIALNVDDASIADNAGVFAYGEPIDPNGAIAYYTSLPIDSMLQALLARGIPAAISNHAGTYVCNHVFYVAQHTLSQIGRHIPSGFIHVPGLLPPEGDAEKGFTLTQMIEAVEVCIAVVFAP